MSIKILRQKRADLVSEAQRAFDQASAENRGLTEAEAKRDDEIGTELAALEGQIARAEAQMERQRTIGAVVDPNQVAGAAQAGDTRRFGSLGEQMLAVRRAAAPTGAVHDPRLSAGPTGLNEGVGAEGGFLVQTDFATEMLQNVYDTGEIASRIRTIPIGPASNGIKMNGVDETSRANGSRSGGIQAFWTGEAQLKLASQPKWRAIAMDLVKLTGLCYATDELLQDAVALEAWLKDAFAEEMTFKVEDAVCNGTGAGMPLGFLNSGATITVPPEPGQAAGTVVSNNIFKMWSRMPPRSRKNGVFLVNADIEPQLFSLSVAVKNVAGTENVGGFGSPSVTYMPPGTVPGQTYGLLMGRPVIPCEYCAPGGTPGDIAFVDLKQYLGIDKGPVQSAVSIHVRFIWDESVFRFVYRFNGQPLWQAPMIPFRGTTTQSPFVVLGAR